MSKRTSLNQLNRELKAIATAHYFITSYYWGTTYEAVNAKDNNPVCFPLMNCFTRPSAKLNKTSVIDLVIEISDKIFDDESNLNDVESDTEFVCRQLLTVITKSTRWNKIGTVQSATLDKFFDKTPDRVAGHTLVIKLSMIDIICIDDLPMHDYDFESSEADGCTCDDAIVMNSDGSYSASVASGETLVLPDQTVNVYLNGGLNQSITFPAITAQTINITT